MPQTEELGSRQAPSSRLAWGRAACGSLAHAPPAPGQSRLQRRGWAGTTQGCPPLAVGVLVELGGSQASGLPCCSFLNLCWVCLCSVAAVLSREPPDGTQWKVPETRKRRVGAAAGTSPAGPRVAPLSSRWPGCSVSSFRAAHQASWSPTGLQIAAAQRPGLDSFCNVPFLPPRRLVRSAETLLTMAESFLGPGGLGRRVPR